MSLTVSKTSGEGVALTGVTGAGAGADDEVSPSLPKRFPTCSHHSNQGWLISSQSHYILAINHRRPFLNCHTRSSEVALLGSGLLGLLLASLTSPNKYKGKNRQLVSTAKCSRFQHVAQRSIQSHNNSSGELMLTLRPSSRYPRSKHWGPSFREVPEP